MFYLSSGFAAGSWFRTGFLDDKTSPFVLGKWGHQLCPRDWVWPYLYCTVKGLRDGMGPQNETRTQWSLGLKFGLHLLLMYLQVLLAKIRSSALQPFAVLCCLFYHYPWHASPEADIPWSCMRNVENIHTQNIIGITSYFFYPSPSVRTLKSQFSCPHRVLFFWACFLLKGTFLWEFHFHLCVCSVQWLYWPHKEGWFFFSGVPSRGSSEAWFDLEREKGSR